MHAVVVIPRTIVKPLAAAIHRHPHHHGSSRRISTINNITTRSPHRQSSMKSRTVMTSSATNYDDTIDYGPEDFTYDWSLLRFDPMLQLVLLSTLPVEAGRVFHDGDKAKPSPLLATAPLLAGMNTTEMVLLVMLAALSLAMAMELAVIMLLEPLRHGEI